MKRAFLPVRAVVVALIVMLLWSVPFAQAAPFPQATSVSLDAYRQLVSEAYAAAQRSDRIGLDASAQHLLGVSGVELPNEAVVAVDNVWLRDALAQEPPDFPHIVAALGAILDALGQARTAPDPDALQKLDQVFEVPPFKSRELPSAWNRFWSGVGDALSDFFERLFNQIPTPNVPTPNPTPTAFGALTPVGWVLIVIGALLILALIAYTLRGVRRAVVAEARVRAEAEEEETITLHEAGERARAATEAGDYRAATRYAYLSTLLWLEERGLVRYDRSRTNREYLAQLRGKPSYEPFVPVVETFERVWYGKRPLDTDGFQQYQRQIAALRGREERPT